MMNKISNSRRITVTALFVMVFMTGYALSCAMYSGLLPDLIQHYGFSLMEASYFDMMNEIGQIFAMIIGIFLLDLLDKNRMLTLMTLLFGVMMVLTGSAPVVILLMGFRLFMGISGSIVDNLTATYIADLYGEKRSRYVSLLHAFFAIGSMIGPQVAAHMVKKNYGFRETYQMVGIVLVACVLLFILVTAIMKKPVPAVMGSVDEAGHRKIPIFRILKNRNILWICVGTALVGGVYYMNIWMPTYLQTVYGSRFSPGFCSFIITLTYLGMLLSRIIFGIVSSKISANTYMKFSCISSALTVVVMILMPGHWSMATGMFLLGLFSGAQHTVQYIMAFEEFPDYSATVVSITAIFLSVGLMVIRLVINGIADMGYYKEAMLIPAVALIGCYFVFSLGYKE